MRKSFMLGLTALTAALLLATAVNTATARNLSTSSQNFEVTWQRLTFGGGTVICEVTLLGSFHSRTIAKVVGSLIGYINHVRVQHPCPTGEGWADNGTEEFLGRRTNNTLPWHVTYQGFLGTLPRITSIDVALSNTSFVIATPDTGSTCLGRYGTATDRIFGRISRNTTTGQATELTPIEGRNTATLRERLGGFFCPANGALTTTGRVTELNLSTLITVTLI